MEILQTYQRESKPIGDVYSQVTQLFHSAPDLLDDFKQFLPESAAHGKAQAARAMAQEEQISNVRGEPGYAAAAPPQAQTPRPTSKMPPMGQFDPPSTSKDNKKRRAGPGTTLTAQSTAQTTNEPALGQSSRTAPVQVGNASKVRANLDESSIQDLDKGYLYLEEFDMADLVHSVRNSPTNANRRLM